jgi:hypothetical protein
VIITIYLLRGIEQKIFFIEIFQSATIIVASLFSIISLNNDNELDILNQPLFWIAIGSLFYFSVILLLESMISPFNPSLQAMQLEYSMLVIIGNIVRYFLYLLATFFYGRNDNGNESNLF